MKINIKASLIERALKELELNKNDLQILHTKQEEKSQIIEIDCDTISISLLSFFLKHSSNIANKIKAQLSAELLGAEINVSEKEDVWETRIHKLADIIECFSRLGVKSFNSDILFNKKWYPAVAIPSFIPASRLTTAHVSVSIKIRFVNEFFDIGFKIYQYHLQDITGKIKKPKLKELFIEFGCRPQECDLLEHKKALENAEKLKVTHKQMLHQGYSLMPIQNRYNIGITSKLL